MDDFLTVTVTGVSITTGAASSGGALPVASSGEIPRYVRVAASAAACVRIGVGAQTAVATDLLVQPGDAVILAVPRGCTHVAAIQLAAAGVVIVTPLEDC
jgi:aspartate/methionine/tyrosine aminotransferase